MASGTYALAKPPSMFSRWGLSKTKERNRLQLPAIGAGKVEAIGYKDALGRIRMLRNVLTNQLKNADKSDGKYFWLSLYTLALCAQERMISDMNDDLIASDIAWDKNANIPAVSSTIGDAASYAKRLDKPEDHFLKALLLSFSGWTLLSTESDKECACSQGHLQKISVDVLVNTSMRIVATPDSRLNIGFLIGAQSDNPGHLEKHYSFKDKSERADNLIIICRSEGRLSHSLQMPCLYSDQTSQAEQFRADKMTKRLDGLISAFSEAA